jgi:hypothetical protein
MEVPQGICGAIGCYRLDVFFQCSTTPAQAVDFVFQSAFIRLGRGVLA